MRLRKKSWTDDFLEVNKEYLITWDKTAKVDFAREFKNNFPVYLEIGCGKGTFITQHALLNPTFNFIGMEKEKTVTGVALKKTLATFGKTPLFNLKYFNNFAEDLSQMFSDDSVDQIFLNFSDPWPKSRHAKKRLTYIEFLNMYSKILKENGELHFKTDNDGLFESTLENLKLTNKWEIISQTTDLYNEQTLLQNNIATEYETKFHNLGKNINKLILRNKK
ncbi:tRNA (guanosine(46)-N7)-methyltransferase TrmB [Mesoplasma syrphidae]|uniref:tRNA (guanine-N(7)-)-methyltransferase n=1 Tax=Mesoplasma syrphidae TaxID=225999 RepID=A0A2K9C9Z1_9MOLU|nr:tRNA (guanosine(46)-N7)-methyltransferase TrmB [Mesoplasma syrphidae]AUF83825.1 tRNA (guanosine(46)-N7)-methyltransferase TrmB [Mesoplasma syrphidae]